MSSTKKPHLSSILPPIAVKRRHLRKYSWLPDVLRLKGSIISRIIGPVLTVTIFSALVCYAATKGYKFVLTSSIFPLLSVVVGLILVFRNGTSYDRYWEGRKSFATVISNVRNLSRQIWVQVAPPPEVAAIKYSIVMTPTQLHRHKTDALLLALSYVIAVKHYLRGEDGIDYPDYHDVLPASFYRFCESDFYISRGNGYQQGTPYDSTTPIRSRDHSAAPSHRASLERSTTSMPNASKRVKVKRSKQNLVEPNASTPLLAGGHRTLEFQLPPVEPCMPLPLIIVHALNKLIFEFRRVGHLETVGPAGANGLSQLIQSMVDQMTAMERVANTPIPASYSIHLKQCITLYLFALPLTMVNELGWATVPIVTVVAFTFMGIEGIADEIEMPFGNDDLSLPLDRYCNDLKEEIFYIIDRLPEGGEGVGFYDDGEGD
ncbi:hypothetical protein AGABI1DRAFT_104757 [Agaricus bisporus var. burnettii JB137-S8]|uniref:Uncharacterized protein n=1 Tax=Agaricus bisporus var. burnettii (strain JB137-S8 / ATCC MYA-4627 / FGSC 10392) TaxID=597362 RepID=K5Y4J1_AGABU|nr:uncharacterized protein AGABI1DRAFT_104757 [Agaricus bisporus var. burnettii JB137-S8]EKM82955.1 hypothetical protein AGABI1DRAFT_104757 [Agaricus bisporus var. burnettii JB137-S8]